MVKFTKFSLVWCGVVGLACVVLLLSLVPSVASAGEFEWDVYALPALTIGLMIYAMVTAEAGESNTEDQAGPPEEQRVGAAQAANAQGLADPFATRDPTEAAGPNLKGRVTYPLFEW